MERSFLITCVKFQSNKFVVKSSLFIFIPLDSLAPQNGSLAVKIKFLCYLEAEILTKTVLYCSHFVKMIRCGGHIRIGANGNILFLVA